MKIDEHHLNVANVAKLAKYLVLSSPGATVFVLQDGTKKIKVYLGNKHECDCGEQPCPHVMFMLLKKFKCPDNHPILFEPGLSDANIEKLLRGTLFEAPIKNKPQRSKSTQSKQLVKAHEQNEITPETICPICLDNLLEEKEPPFCYSCGNSAHRACMHQYLQYNGSNATCPFCRAYWQDGRAVTVTKTQCTSCLVEAGKCSYIDKYSANRYCAFCFVQQKQGSFSFGQRQIILKKNQKNEKNTQRYQILQHLMQREITQNDYHLLGMLDNEQASQQQTLLKMPGYLVPKCFKPSNVDRWPCALCQNDTFTPNNLLCFEMDHEVLVDFRALRKQLQVQNGQNYSLEALQKLVSDNSQRFLSCARHAAHDICLMICTVKQSVLYHKTEYIAAKVLQDKCSECGVFFLKEWLRDSKLEEAAEEDLDESKANMENQVMLEKKLAVVKKQPRRLGSMPPPMPSVVDLTSCLMIRGCPQVLK